MDERTFLAQLAEHPTDETRLVYADWLDEHGEHDKAEFIRCEHSLSTARARIEALGPTLDGAWLGAVYGHHALELVSVQAGKKIETIKLLRELTGKGLAECKELSEQLPSIVFGGDREDLNKAKRRFDAIGAEVRMVGLPIDADWIVARLSHYALVLVSYPPEKKIEVIKALRMLTGLGLKEAKAMSESLPATVLQTDAARLGNGKSHLESAGATVRLVARPR